MVLQSEQHYFIMVLQYSEDKGCPHLLAAQLRDTRVEGLCADHASGDFDKHICGVKWLWPSWEQALLRWCLEGNQPGKRALGACAQAQ